MGHYRSECGYEDEDDRAAQHRQRVLTATKKKLKAAIDKDGVAAVLAELVVDGDTMFSIKYRG